MDVSGCLSFDELYFGQWSSRTSFNLMPFTHSVGRNLRSPLMLETMVKNLFSPCFVGEIDYDGATFSGCRQFDYCT